MRITATIFLVTLCFGYVQPSYAVQTTVIVGTTEIMTPSNDDFSRMPLEQMGEWLFDRQNLLGTISREIESLNHDDAVDLIRQVKFDRRCATGMGWCGRLFGAAVVITGLASSITTLPPQIGYALAGGGALVVGFNELMKFFGGRANDNVTTLMKLQSELLDDYREKQLIYERRLAEQQRQQRFQEEFNVWRRLAIQNLPSGTRDIIFDPQQVGRLRVMSAQHVGDDIDAMERGELQVDAQGVEVARAVTGRAPPPAADGPARLGEERRRARVKTKVRVKKSAAPAATRLVEKEDDVKPDEQVEEGEHEKEATDGKDKTDL